VGGGYTPRLSRTTTPAMIADIKQDADTRMKKCIESLRSDLA
jgi:hypothetical protein